MLDLQCIHRIASFQIVSYHAAGPAGALSGAGTPGADGSVCRGAAVGGHSTGSTSGQDCDTL